MTMLCYTSSYYTFSAVISTPASTAHSSLHSFVERFSGWIQFCDAPFSFDHNATEVPTAHLPRPPRICKLFSQRLFLQNWLCNLLLHSRCWATSIHLFSLELNSLIWPSSLLNILLRPYRYGIYKGATDYDLPVRPWLLVVLRPAHWPEALSQTVLSIVKNRKYPNAKQRYAGSIFMSSFSLWEIISDNMKTRYPCQLTSNAYHTFAADDG